MRLTEQQRNAVDRTVSSLRTLFEREFDQMAAGRFGLHAEPRAGTHIEEEAALSLTPTERAQRVEMLGALEYLIAQGADEAEAIDRLVREATFTAVNRLLAVRVAEGVGVFPEVVSVGPDSQLFRDLTRDLFPLLETEESSFWTYLQICGDELGPAVPLLFDRRMPVNAFSPTPPTVKRALGLVNADEVASSWNEPEALGWAYQFFNGEDERREMRTAGAPRDARELAIRNQFFTPGYVVDWLVQNTLGLRLRQAGFEVELPLQMEEAGDSIPLELAEVKVLDPACGSGHFLLGAYELLEQAWVSKGIGPETAAPNILRCLFGIEIDPRAAQVAQSVLILRARKACPKGELPAPGIVTARDFPDIAGPLKEIFAAAPENVQELAGELAEALDFAPELGPLLKVEQRLREGIQRRFSTPTLGDSPEANDKGDSLEHQILALLGDVARTFDASPAARMFAADAVDAVRFVELCLQRYDAVLMNPPFGDAIPNTDDYLKAAYPGSASDLAAVFVERGVELLTGDGRLGAITTRAPFFLKTFQDWRSTLALPRLHAMLDLGVGVMHGAMVQAAAYTLSQRAQEREARFHRLLDEPEKERAVREGAQVEDTYTARPTDFLDIPGAPTAYWLGELSELFEGASPEAGVHAFHCRQGLVSADDFRFVRCWWEVGTSALGGSWKPFAKGGEYSPYFSDLSLVVNWQQEGKLIREFSRARFQNAEYYGRPGLTWSGRSQKGFSVRALPSGEIFSHRGPGIFVNDDDHTNLFRLSAWLNSPVAAALLEAIVPFGSYEVGAVQRLPFVDPGEEAARLARELTKKRAREDEVRETTHLFSSPWASLPDFSDLAELSEQIDEAIEQVTGVKDAKPLSATYPTRWFREEYIPPGPPNLEDEISYLLGAALGRWDIRIGAGLAEAASLPDPFSPPPSTSRGMLVAQDGAHPADAPEAYPLELPVDALLHDDRGHSLDVVVAMERAAEIVEAGPLAESPLELRGIDLRQYLRDRFFKQHLSRYSGSNRKAPVYWQLGVPSGGWGLWLYAPALSRGTLFAVAHAAAEKLRTTRDQAKAIRDHSKDEQSREERERLERSDALVAELETFHRKADEVTRSGWEPDLNDGIVLCACPLKELFVERRWREELEKRSSKLELGEYPWASVQRQFYGRTG